MLVRKCTGLQLTQFQLLDISNGLSYLHSLEIVHGDLKGVRIGFCVSACGILTISHRRIIFSLMDRVVHGSTISGSLASPLSTVLRLPLLASRDLPDGWHPSSSASTTEHPVSPRASQMCSLWGWSPSRWGMSTAEYCFHASESLSLVSSLRCSPDKCRSQRIGPRQL